MSPYKKLIIIGILLILLIGGAYTWLILKNRNIKNITETLPVQTIPELQEKEIFEMKKSDFKGRSSLKPLVPAQEAYNENNGSWNPNRTRFLFLDRHDEKLKWRDLSGKETLITPLKKLTPPLQFLWSSDEAKVLVIENKNLFLITLATGARKKVSLDFNPIRVLWIKEDGWVAGEEIPSFAEKLWINDKNNMVFEIDLNKPDRIKKTMIEIDLAKAIFINDNRVLSYKTEENATTLIITNTSDYNQQNIINQEDFVAKDMEYSSDKERVYLQESETGIWYEINIKKTN